MTLAHGELEILTRNLGGAPMIRDGSIAPAAAGWYHPRPATPDEWRRHAEAVRASAPLAWADVLAPALGGGGAAASRLDRVVAGQGIVITTGQQPGLFGGPLYTWWKALTALELADAVEAATGIPAAPVFWAATDDADFAEASATFVAVVGGLERLALPASGTEGMRLADVPLPDTAELLRRLAAGAGSAVFPDALALAAAAYHEGATVGDAYVTLLRSLLEPLGIAVLDAAHPDVRQAGGAVLDSALHRAPDVERALEARERELRAAGFRPQVPLVRGRSLVFSAREGRRERMAIGSAGRAADRPDDTRGPNVLLRPVMEREILPTAAYVAGPGELAYFAQVSAVAEAIGARAPLAVPRWSGTVIEPHVRRLMERHGLDMEVLSRAGAAEGLVARQALPANVLESVSRLRQAAHGALEALGGALQGENAPLIPPTVLRGAERDLERRIGRLERRLVAAAKRQQVEAMRDVATLRAALVPEGKPQERVLNLLPLLARHGPELLERARAAAAHHARALVGSVGTREPSTEQVVAESGARERTR